MTLAQDEPMHCFWCFNNELARNFAMQIDTAQAAPQPGGTRCRPPPVWLPRGSMLSR